MTATVTRHFVTEEHERMVVREWKRLTLQAIVADITGKPHKFFLEELVSWIYALQSALSWTHRRSARYSIISYSSLWKTLKPVQLCFYPVVTVKGLISDPHRPLAIGSTAKFAENVYAPFASVRYRGFFEHFQNRNDILHIIYSRKISWSTRYSKKECLAVLLRNKHICYFVLSITENDEQATSSADDNDTNVPGDKYLDDFESLSGNAHAFYVLIDLNEDLK